jgi:hypothetical protein
LSHERQGDQEDDCDSRIAHGRDQEEIQEPIEYGKRIGRWGFRPHASKDLRGKLFRVSGNREIRTEPINKSVCPLDALKLKSASLAQSHVLSKFIRFPPGDLAWFVQM